MICEIHGVAKAARISIAGCTQRVLVIDDTDAIRLEIETAQPAGLSATQARALATYLNTAATRLEARKRGAKK